MDYQPIGDTLLISNDEVSEETVGGIVVQSTEKPNTGTILSVGCGKEGSHALDDFTVGMKVIFDRTMDMVDITLENKKYIIVRAIEIVGVMN